MDRKLVGSMVTSLNCPHLYRTDEETGVVKDLWDEM